MTATVRIPPSRARRARRRSSRSSTSTSPARAWRPNRRRSTAGSDYGPFIAVGIPAGGLFSGAEGIKTPQQAAVFGGTAGVAFDACNHQACDSIAAPNNNLNTTALAQMGDAVADAVWTLGKTKTGFFPDGSRMAFAAQAFSKDQVDHWGGQLIR